MTTKPKTKGDAICTIVSDARRERASYRTYREVSRALDALGLDTTERVKVLQALDYFRPDGMPCGWLAAAMQKAAQKK